MIDPRNPTESLGTILSSPIQEERSSDAWKAFVAHVGRLRAKPTFDQEERDYKFEIALRGRVLLDGMRDRTALLPQAVETVFQGSFSGHPFDLTLDPSWLQRWARKDPPSLIEAASRFGDGHHSLEESFAWFAERAKEAEAAGKIAADDPSLLANGSLLNFCASPESAPVLLPWAFELLEQLFGHERKHPKAPVAEKYANHLAFSRWLMDRLQREVPVRDMVDLHSLVWHAGREHEFWLRQPEDDERPHGGDATAKRNTSDGADRERAYLSICAIYKNEASYLHEWMEFHRLMGVERFFLYDNKSTDNHLEVLAPYIDDGSVTLHDWSILSLQLKAYAHCLEEHRFDSRWIAFIDIDEFLFSPTGQPLPEILRDLEQWGPGVGVNMMQYTTCGHRTRPEGLVIESYDRTVPPVTRTPIKSIVDPARVDHCVSSHYFAYHRQTTVDENGFPIWGPMTKSPSVSRLRLNHYWTKSEEECRERRAKLGPEGRFQPWPDFASLRLRDELMAQRDEAILQYLPPLKRALGKE